MAESDADRVVKACKDLVRAMVGAEALVGSLQATMERDELAGAFREALAWAQDTDELPRNSYAREVAREILAQLSSAALIQGFQGSPTSYIA